MGARLHVITGVANEQSIAWAVAAQLLTAGERCLLLALPRNVRRAEKLVEHAGFTARVLPLDVRDDASLAAVAAVLAERDEPLGGVLHAIAYAAGDELSGPTLEVSRAGFLEAMNVSVYSLLALVRTVRPAMRAGSSVVALSYHGAQKCMPGYNLMGIAKAALESACRYLAYDLGPEGIRVNAVSAGPLVTLSSSAFAGIEERVARAGARSALRRPTELRDVAAAICHLLSDHSDGITAQCLYVDNGLSAMGE